MRRVTWLHISDFHLRDSHAWAQDVVLSSMCKDIERCRREFGTIDFVLVTGDIAFAGKPHEYDIAAAFFEEIVKVTGVPRERIFCIPGNHDVDRDRQRMCFLGARQTLQSQNAIDSFLAAPEELKTLLQRQESYREFQESFFAEQQKKWTDDMLGYVSLINVENLSIAIAGINTAWLSEGGASDHGKLLAGERQVINALRIAVESDAHFVIAMGHHPFHLLNDFDRRSVQWRIEESCHFYHCGHLHDPETRNTVNSGGHCLSVATGAAFESRHSHNAFCVVSLDVMQAQQSITTFQYKPSDGAFSYEKNSLLPFTINATELCKVADLGSAIVNFSNELSPVAYYLAALLTEVQSEMPIEVGNAHVFGSFDLLSNQSENQLKTASIAFMAVRNPMRLFAGRMPLAEFLTCYGEAVLRYGLILKELGDAHPELREKLAERESDAQILSGVEPCQPFSHTLKLLRELAADHDWDALRSQAERHLDSPVTTIAMEARRMLALSLSQSPDNVEKTRAVEIYNRLVEGEAANAADYAHLASLLIDKIDYEAAKVALFDGIKKFPENERAYLQIGQAIVEATGDRKLRDELISLGRGRREK
ncbi:MAG: metallophosphoesterase [Gammaproteobacteria bacterium]